MAKTKTQATKQTPLMIQYNEIKEKYPGAMLLFRVGDFYETFGEDAIKASKILDITLTKRANGSASHIELAGFPHHSLENYMPKLVRAGERVAICDQLEDPKSVKGIVKRGVTELVTPGVALNDQVLEGRSNNFLSSIHFNKNLIGIAFLDISTGEFMCSEGNIEYAQKLLSSFNPAEIIYCKKNRKEYFEHFENQFHCYSLDDWAFSPDFGLESLTKHFKTKNLKGFGIENLKDGIAAAGAILQYLSDTEHNHIQHISSISRIDEERFVWLDRFTIRNLELIYPQQQDGVPLIDILDETITPMGARLLKNWIVLPLKELVPIQERLHTVEALLNDAKVKDIIAEHLSKIGDLERLISKVAVRRINPRETYQLKRALDAIEPIQELLKKSKEPLFKKLADKLNTCNFIREKITAEIKEDAPALIHLGNYIAEGVDEELDDLRKISKSGKDYLIDVQVREQQKTGISSLKVAYNKVFGYYLEVTNAHKDKVPPEWIRKQTLTNGERYITEELKIYEEKILGAEGKIHEIENRIFNELVLSLCDYVEQVQQNAKAIAHIDCLISFAQIAKKNKYCKPEVTDSKVLNIKQGRHPVIEKNLPISDSYIPNDIYLDDESQQIIVITGPNMAGKSALLRQTALITLMAQMGSFVPAKAAELGLVDKVFTRVGASDNLSKGESTFMVEMTETASILNNLSDRSLVLMDEIGRGTSTYDGVSLAWAITEFLHSGTKLRPKTLFATHYHELNELADSFPRIKNFNVSVKDIDGKILFMRKLVPGGTQHSFGIHVAQMAGIPNTVLIRSHEILAELEQTKKKEVGKKIATIPVSALQVDMFSQGQDPRWTHIKDLLEKTDINRLTPVEALMKLNELKSKLGDN